jgi:hypothetical protein
VQLSRVPKYIGRGFVPHYFFCSSQQQQIYHCQPDSSFVLSRFSNYLRFYITTNNMYTSIFAVLALAASTLAAPAPIEKRQGAVTCGSTVSVLMNPFHISIHFTRIHTSSMSHHILKNLAELLRLPSLRRSRPRLQILQSQPTSRQQRLPAPLQQLRRLRLQSRRSVAGVPHHQEWCLHWW